MKSIKCPNCGLVNWASAEGCKRCGAIFSFATPAGPAALPPSPFAPAQWSPELSAPQEGGNAANGYDAQPSAYQEAAPYHQPAQYQEPPYNSYGYYGGSQYVVEGNRRKGMAVASLVLGILAVLSLGILGILGIIGLVLGIVAYRRAKQSPAKYGGEGMALAGMIVSGLSLFMFAYMGIVAAIAIPNLLAARKAANEGSAISSMRTLVSAEATYQATVGAGSYGTLEELVAAGLVDDKLGKGVKNGYRFEIRVKPARSKSEWASFEAVAVPVKYGSSGAGTGKRSFYVDESGVLRAGDKGGIEASSLDPPVGQNSLPDRDPYRSSRNSSRSNYSDGY